MPGYRELFERNYGIFTEAEQERLRTARILIIGDSGTGETIAHILARSGCEHFTLAGDEHFVPADMNRQPGCTLETIGMRKLAVLEETIRRINPAAQVTLLDHLPTEDELELLACDIVIPAVDDLAYSILIFRWARRRDIPAVLCMPSGSMGWVSVFTAATPTIEHVFGIPVLPYPDLRRVTRSREYRCAQYTFITQGDWRVRWFWDYFIGKHPLALFCPVSWIASSLAAQEVLKIATGKWKPVYAPQCWHIRKGRVSRTVFSRFVRYHRQLGWKIFGNGIGQHFHRQAFWFWRKVFRFLQDRQDRAEHKIDRCTP